MVDATFLIDLHREQKNRKRAQHAHQFMAKNKGSEASVCVIAWGEFLEGFEEGANDPVASHFSGYFTITAAELRVSEIWARISRNLRSDGNLIDSNDLWIAACALAAGQPLITRNTAHFERVDGLELIFY